MENENLKINKDRKRFELEVEGQTALINFTQIDDVISLTHTEVPESLQGKGVGNKIVSATLSYIKENNLKVAPLCSFVEAYISRHPEWDPIVTNGW
jgi:predicted GNAT family acetyltransferase